MQNLPAAVEEECQHREVHRYTKVACRAMFVSWKPPGGFLGAARRRPARSLPAKESKFAKIRFAILVFILASMVVLIWRSIPS
ncbi:MAG: hypothetical protein JMM76_00625 [Candidatus Xiphinematobacter sp.]|nr:MAG: hypothetical protein JMM76_00625 [Candidatus Xiphinematobacter sp.]QQY09971.1 MAG: hypothetical protein JMM78_00635 [Candidatus Xiphinematobacter sp.]QQY10704.1 MAG: hypothetical protein JMM74_00620 [Candidatus Xiphinematobacter sp.]